MSHSRPIVRCLPVSLGTVLLAFAILGGQGHTAAGQAAGPEPDASWNLPTFTLPPVTSKGIRLIAYGDMRFADPKMTHGTNPRVRAWLAAKVGAEKPDALLLTGDMPYVGSAASDWDQYRRETESWTRAGFPVLPSIGNHELYFDHDKALANYMQAYPMLHGHRYYSALMGNVEVISLDMNSPTEPRSEQTLWFAAQLEHLPKSVEFLFILYHVPWVADDQSQMIAGIPSPQALLLRGILERHLPAIRAQVMVISGHIHNYERFERRGVEYLVTGGGGAQPYPILLRGNRDLYKGGGFPVYNYVTLELENHQLKGTMWKVVDPDAAVLSVEEKDHFEMRAR
jgi:hypothetical protein